MIVNDKRKPNNQVNMNVQCQKKKLAYGKEIKS